MSSLRTHVKKKYIYDTYHTFTLRGVTYNVRDERIRNYCGLGIILSTHRDVPCFNAACDVK